MLPIAILAGGLASRLGPVTHGMPKSLIRFKDRPFIDWQLALLSAGGYTNIVLCLSHLATQIQEFVENGDKWGVAVRYSFDGESQLGTGGSILNALNLLGEEFGVIYGDSYLPINFKSVEDTFLEGGKKSLMTVYKNSNKLDKSNVEFTNGVLKRYVKNGDKDMSHIDYGLSYFTRSAFDPFVKGSSFDLSRVLFDLAQEGEITGYEVYRRFYEVGSLGGIHDFKNFVERG
jgi:NDP-sugar pyrophosphorylase family protein